MNRYELAVVLHPDLEIDLDTTTDKIEKIIAAGGGKIEKKDNWGKKKLAYVIKKQAWGIYIFYEVMLEPTKVREINNKFLITEEILRFLIVSLENIRYLKKPNITTNKVSKKVEEKV